MFGQRMRAAIVALLVSSLSSFANEQTVESRVAENVQRLGHARYAVREQAARELTAIGEPALKQLHLAAASNDEEVRRRAEGLIQSIETRSLNELLIRPTQLHLRYQGKPLDEVIADVSTKTGLPFILDPKAMKSPKELMTFDTGNVPYWEAIEKFLAVCGLSEIADAPPPAIANVYQPRFNGRIHRRTSSKLAPAAGPRIRLTDNTSPLSASTDKAIRVKVLPREASGASATKGSNEISFNLDVVAAPQLACRGIVAIDVRRAIDDQGALLAQSHTRSYSTPVDADIDEFGGKQGIIAQRIVINGRVANYGVDELALPVNGRHVPVVLTAGNSNSKMLKELSGVVTARVLTAPQRFLVVDNLTVAPTGKTVAKGDYRLTLTESKLEKNAYLQVRFRLETPNPASIGSGIEAVNLLGGNQFVEGFDMNNANGTALSNIEFRDADDKIMPNIALSPMEQTFTENNVLTEYQAVIPIGGKANTTVKFVLSGRKAVCVEVPFTLKNVPLP